MFYRNNPRHFNFANMKKIVLFIVVLLLAVLSFGQTVPIRAKTFTISYAGDSYSINLNEDSILIDASDLIWFADKFGSDTLLFGDGSYMTTAPSSGGTDTGYVKTVGDSMYGYYTWYGNGGYMTWNNSAVHLIINDNDYTLCKIDGDKFIAECPACGGSDYRAELTHQGLYIAAGVTSMQYGSDTITGGTLYMLVDPRFERDALFFQKINGLRYDSDSAVTADDGSIVLSTGISGWGEVYAFNAGTIDEWAEFIISSDGTVYLKSNSTDVSNADDDGKLCIFDNGSGVTIRNRLGGSRTIKYRVNH